MMKRLTYVLGALAVAIALSTWLHAQNQAFLMNNTTLSGAINASQTTLVLASASASSGSSFGAPAAGQCLFVEGELMRIVSMASTTATVTRATAGASAHPTSAVIFTATCNAFRSVDPPIVNRAGTSLNTGGGAAANLCIGQPGPWINTTNGNVWWCNPQNGWLGTNFRPFTYGSVPVAQ